MPVATAMIRSIQRTFIVCSVFLGLILAMSGQLCAQTSTMTLEQVIEQARTSSVAALEAKALFVSSYWAWRSYRVSRLPSLNLYGNLASFDRSLRQLQNYETGELVYTSNYNMQNSIGLSISQNINISTVSYYFNLLLSMSNLESARQNHKNASDLYEIAQAKADYDLVKEQIGREEDQFDEKVRILAEDFIDQQQLVKIYKEADVVAQERYTIALNRFTVGDISVTDLNYAEQEKDQARQNYISQLYLSWLYYYNLRYITFYNFFEGCDIMSEN